MTPNELTALLDRISSGTTTHDDAVWLAEWIRGMVLTRPQQADAAILWLNAHQDAA